MEITALTATETERLSALEMTIEQGLQTFVEVGNALMEIRDGRLYRAAFGTFEEYCRERWQRERRWAYQLIEAAQVVENVRHGAHQIPTNERQVRPLVALSSEQQLEVWPLIVETAPNGKVTASHVRLTVDNYLNPDPYEAHLDAALADKSKPVCQSCGQVYDGPRCSDCNPYNYLRDNRRSTVSDIYTPQGMDACQTPAYAIDPLSPYLPREWTIWESAAGEGNLVEALFDSGFSSVISTDLLRGENFFEFEPDNWDCIVTNPPYSVHFQWLERCYKLGRPFALLLKVEILGTKAAQELFDQYGVEVIFVRPRINFKMPNKGWEGGGAQFPTAWFTYGLNIGKQMSFVRLKVNDSSN